MKRKLISWAVAGMLVSGAGGVQAFPEKALTLVVPFGPGTSVDTHSRDFAQVLAEQSGQAVVVDNRPGAEGTIGAQAILRAPRDGYTLMFTSSSIPVLDPILKKNMSYNPVTDLTPICTVGRTSNVVNLTGGNPIKTAEELIAVAKREPGSITFAYSSATTRLAGELFQQAAGIELMGVPYKASNTGLADVASGEVDLFFIDDVSASSFYQGDRLRPLAVAGNERIPALPNVPSAKEIGVPAYSIQPWFGVYVATGTPEPIVEQLRDHMAKALQRPSAKSNMAKRGLEPLLLCGDDLKKFQADEIKLWTEVVKKAGIEPQ